ncbi:hypothetical protein N8977_04435 [Alphaproteobacteria bacterium]|nr:hypothetical protein [Alphaproteobacteria bacterium]
MKNFVKCSICLIFIFSIALKPSFAEALDINNPKQIESFLVELYSKPETIEQVVASFRVSADKEVIVKEHLKSLLVNPKLIKVMSREFVNQGVLDNAKSKNSASAAGRAFGYQFITQLTVDGIKRLPDERVLEYIDFVNRFFDLIEPRHCRALMGAGAKQKDEIEASFAAIRNMSASELRAYFFLNREAVDAELNDWPVVINLNDYEIKTGTAAFEKSFAKKLGTHPFSSTITTALTDPSNAQDKDFCIAGKFVMVTIYELGGMAGNWFRRSFVLSL